MHFKTIHVERKLLLPSYTILDHPFGPDHLVQALRNNHAFNRQYKIAAPNC